MDIEEALLIIDRHPRNPQIILNRVRDRRILKQLIRTEFFSDMLIEHFTRHPHLPNAELLIDILKEISQEDANKIPDINKGASAFQETSRIYKEAKERYLFSFLKDPLASLLIDKLRLTPLKSVVLGFVLTLITYAMGYALYFILKQPIAGITKTGIDLVYDFSLVPFVFGFYVWVSSRAGYLFLELKRRGIRLGSDQEFDNFAEKSVKNSINHGFWSAASILMSICLIIMTVIAAATHETRWGPREANYVLFCLWKVPILWGFSWYMVFMVFMKETITIISLRRLLKKEEFSLNTFHRDRQGGLAPIVKYAENLSYFVIASGYGFILLFVRSWKFGYFREDIVVDIGLLVYIGLACFFFFFPLGPAHRLLTRLKLELVDKNILSARIPLLPPLRPAAVLKFAFLSSLPIITLLLAPLARSALNF